MSHVCFDDAADFCKHFEMIIHKDCYSTIIKVWLGGALALFLILKFIPWTFVSYILSIIPLKIKSAKKEISVAMVPDEEAQVSMTLALASDITKLNLSDLSKFYEKEFKIDDYEGRGYEYLIFNYDNSLINDINFRKAIAYAIDKQKIIDEAYVGNATLVNFPLHSKSKYYDSELKGYDYNLENSKKYLEKIKSVRSFTM